MVSACTHSHIVTMPIQFHINVYNSICICIACVYKHIQTLPYILQNIYYYISYIQCRIIWMFHYVDIGMWVHTQVCFVHLCM